jgi:hypothetical protein
MMILSTANGDTLRTRPHRHRGCRRRVRDVGEIGSEAPSQLGHFAERGVYGCAFLLRFFTALRDICDALGRFAGGFVR